MFTLEAVAAPSPQLHGLPDKTSREPLTSFDLEIPGRLGTDDYSSWVVQGPLPLFLTVHPDSCYYSYLSLPVRDLCLQDERMARSA